MEQLEIMKSRVVNKGDALFIWNSSQVDPREIDEFVKSCGLEDKSRYNTQHGLAWLLSDLSREEIKKIIKFIRSKGRKKINKFVFQLNIIDSGDGVYLPKSKAMSGK